MKNITELFEGVLDPNLDASTAGEVICKNMTALRPSGRISGKYDATGHELQVGDCVFYDGKFYTVFDLYRNGIYVANDKETVAINAFKCIWIPDFTPWYK